MREPPRAGPTPPAPGAGPHPFHRPPRTDHHPRPPDQPPSGLNLRLDDLSFGESPVTCSASGPPGHRPFLDSAMPPGRRESMPLRAMRCRTPALRAKETIKVEARSTRGRFRLTVGPLVGAGRRGRQGLPVVVTTWRETGVCHFHVPIGAAGKVLGRVNLVDAADGGAEPGYRIAERAAGRGLAASAAREVCGLAANGHGAATPWTATTRDGAAFWAVLARAGVCRHRRAAALRSPRQEQGARPPVLEAFLGRAAAAGRTGA
ncbi:hypothetical protein SUDANB176_00331 [Streptomyces sp. enrichment culture]